MEEYRYCPAPETTVVEMTAELDIACDAGVPQALKNRDELYKIYADGHIPSENRIRELCTIGVVHVKMSRRDRRFRTPLAELDPELRKLRLIEMGKALQRRVISRKLSNQRYYAKRKAERTLTLDNQPE